jgi:hypothetical protein
MNEKSMLTPPNGAEKLASRLDPPEYGTAHCQYSSLYTPFPHTHRYLVLVADLGDLSTLFSGFWIRHRDRELVDVDGRPFRIPVSVQIFIVGTDSIFSERSP